jgi:hypothetical protein
VFYKLRNHDRGGACAYRVLQRRCRASISDEAHRDMLPHTTRLRAKPSRLHAFLESQHSRRRVSDAVSTLYRLLSLVVVKSLPAHPPLASTSTDASAATSAAIRTSALFGEKFRERNEICAAVKAPSSPSYITSTHPHHRILIQFLVASISQSNARHTHPQCCPRDYHGL